MQMPVEVLPAARRLRASSFRLPVNPYFGSTDLSPVGQASTRSMYMSTSRKIDLDSAPTVTGSRYPAPYDAPCLERFRRCLGDAAGLTQFGVNLLRLPPGCWSS